MNGSCPSEQAAMTDRTPQDPPQHVAAALIGRPDAVRDEEGHGARVVGDDLVAEALRLEGLRVVAQQIVRSASWMGAKRSVS